MIALRRPMFRFGRPQWDDKIGQIVLAGLGLGILVLLASCHGEL